MRVAVLYDIHANLPALEAVMTEVRNSDIDRVVVGGDVLPGPMPCETLDLLLGLALPVEFLYGNGELGVLAQLAAGDSGEVKYSGTVSGEALPEPLQGVLRWTAGQLRADQQDAIRAWHGTIEADGFTRLTSEKSLLPVFKGLASKLVVCGHTHMQFDRMVGTTRVVNAGSVGMPFGDPGADWLVLAGGIELRHTPYDLESAANRVRATAYPQAEEFASLSILAPRSEEDMAHAFANVSFGKDPAQSHPNKRLQPTAAAAIMSHRS